MGFGLRFHQRTTVTLLGFNAPVSDTILPDIAAAYQRHRGPGVPDGLAWVRGNLEVGQQGLSGLSWCCFNACAVTPEGYYYIAYSVPETVGTDLTNPVSKKIWVERPPWRSPGEVKAKGIYLIRRAHWNTEAQDWKQIPQDILGQQGVNIGERQ